MDIDLEPIDSFEAPIYHKYRGTSAKAVTPFLYAIKRGELLGHVSRATGKVLFPPLGACPESGQPTDIGVLLGDAGVIIGFTTVHLPIPGSKLVPPFVVANILLDGADQTCSHLVGGCETDTVEIGMRVKALWRPKEEWVYGLENIDYFVPTGEPLVDVDAFEEQKLKDAAKRKEEYANA